MAALAATPGASGASVQESEASNLWVPASEMHWYISSITFDATSIVNWPAWLLPTGIDRGVSWSSTMPSWWSTFHLDLYWANEGAGTGDVRFVGIHSNAGDGDSLTGGTSVNTTVTAPSQDVLEVTRLISSLSNDSTHLFNFRVYRDGGIAGDLGNSIGLVGAMLVRAS